MRLTCTVIASLPTLALAAAPSVAQNASQLLNTQRARIEALTILGADFGLASGEFDSTGHDQGAVTETDLTVTKFGGDGDVGDLRPLGNLPIGWQPRIQGSMGWLDSTDHLETGPFAGDVSEFKAFAIEFGGGARFWFNDALSIAPTIMGMYGHTSNTFDVNAPLMPETLSRDVSLGLIDWEVNTWTVRPAMNVQYLLTLDRVIVTLSSDAAFFHTQSFSSSNAGLSVVGESGSWDNKLDLDIPLGIMLDGHELRTGGYLSRTDLYGGLHDGLQVEHINEVHARLVLDFLGQFWKLQWLGVGASYLWGPSLTGWTFGADVQFRF